MQSKLIDEQIREELKKTGGNISRVARTLGIPYHIMAQRYGPTALGILPKPTPRPLNIKELGKEGISEHVIAIKRCGTEWPEEFKDVLADARRRFDLGTHEMVQTHNKGWVVQYLIPRRRPTRRRYFFSEGFSR